MSLIDEARARELYDATGLGVEISGGSAANTIVGVASFGGRGQYVGKVRNDQLGEVFGHDLRSTGVLYDTPSATDGPATGRCLILVTPDAQRTMGTFLGASVHLGKADINVRLIHRAKIH
jgi:sugar/nucleoside kinase (ribokinase family)